MSKSNVIKRYESIVGSLSEPSKMPGWGYGLPALTSCNVGARLAKIEGTTCSTCYACKGHYQFPNTQAAQEFRLKSINNPSWTVIMAAMISSHSEKYFRWHDSGDIVSMEHLIKIVEVADLLPTYKFWLPTQEHKLIALYRKLHGEFPDNLIVRLSTPLIDGRPVTTDLCTSGVHKDKPNHGFMCVAPLQGNKCGACRACWDKGIKHVSYRHH